MRGGDTGFAYTIPHNRYDDNCRGSSYYCGRYLSVCLLMMSGRGPGRPSPQKGQSSREDYRERDVSPFTPQIDVKRPRAIGVKARIIQQGPASGGGEDRPQQSSGGNPREHAIAAERASDEQWHPDRGE